MNTPQLHERRVVNKARRRRSGFFGFNTGLAILSLSVVMLGLIASSFLPLGIVVSGTVALFVAVIYIFRDGTDAVLGRLRRTRHYTRTGLNHIPVLKDEKRKITR
jgi:hypothetical protein